MKKNALITGYFKKLEAYMQEISQISHCTGEVQEELFSSMEILQSNAGGKILLLFLDESLQFYSRLIPILLSKANDCKMDQFNRIRMDKISEYIKIHLNGNIKEKDVADLVGMSTGHFSRFFNKMYRCSFIEYLNRYKVDLASKMLKDNRTKIVDICYSCGFSSPNQFNRVFKKEKNMTPSEYRSVENRE